MGGDFRAALRQARRVLVKVGSAVLTTDKGLNLAVVQDLARQLAALHARGLDVVLVSSGAVAAGRGVIRAPGGLSALPDRQAASAIGQSRLMHAYDEAFAGHGVVSAQVLLTRDGLRARKRFLNARNTFATLLEWRAVPIVNENDTVSVEELEFGDNDFLASLLINLVEADVFLNITSAPGVYAANPDLDPHAACLDCIEDVAALDVKAMCGGGTAAGRGGMYSKLLAAQRVAQLGAPTLILPGSEPDAVTRAMDGECVGTFVMPDDHRISRRKFWMAYNAAPSGTIRVDEGAVRALTQKHRSLLPVGVTGVEGRFGRGSLVRVAGPDGTVLGLGLCNYSAAETRRVMGKKSTELRDILGESKVPYPEVVHRDNLLLDAVV